MLSGLLLRLAAFLRLLFRLCCCQTVIVWGRKMFRRHLDAKSLLLFNIVLAMVNVFLLVMHLHVHMPRPEAYFRAPISAEERQQMIAILKTFTRALDQHNILYFIGSGTLLGSYRHHGPIPWDDDTDLFLFKPDLPRIKQAVQDLEPHFRLYPGDTLSPSMKFFSVNSSRKFIHHAFTWPYVDLFFIDGNETHFLSSDLQDDPVPRDKIFPLVRRPYQNLRLLSPCNVTYILRDYKIDECYNRRFSHVMEVPMFTWTQRYLPCSRLYSVFPFVFRQAELKSTRVIALKETLKVDDWIIGNATVRYPAVCSGRKGIFEA